MHSELFIKLVPVRQLKKEMELEQLMSRKGSCIFLEKEKLTKIIMGDGEKIETMRKLRDVRSKK